MEKCPLDVSSSYPFRFASLPTRDPSKVRPKVEALIVRGSVTLGELLALRMNSFEWAAIVPVLTDEAFLYQMRHSLANCARVRMPPVVYDEAVTSLYAPELVQRYEALKRKVTTMPRKSDTDTQIDTLEEQVKKMTSTLELLLDLEDAVRRESKGEIATALKALDRGRQRGTVTGRSGE